MSKTIREPIAPNYDTQEHNILSALQAMPSGRMAWGLANQFNIPQPSVRRAIIGLRARGYHIITNNQEYRLTL
jgi:DNA-binding IclR family transcriptional regulator